MLYDFVLSHLCCLEMPSQSWNLSITWPLVYASWLNTTHSFPCLPPYPWPIHTSSKWVRCNDAAPADAVKLALDKPLWRQLAASGAMHWWCMPNNDDEEWSLVASDFVQEILSQIVNNHFWMSGCKFWDIWGPMLSLVAVQYTQSISWLADQCKRLLNQALVLFCLVCSYIISILAWFFGFISVAVLHQSAALLGRSSLKWPVICWTRCWSQVPTQLHCNI